KLWAIEQSAGPAQCLEYGLIVAEVLQQGNDVGKAFVERGHVIVGRFHKLRPYSVEQRMRALVRYHVVRQTSKDDLARNVSADIGCTRREVTKYQRVDL